MQSRDGAWQMEAADLAGWDLGKALHCSGSQSPNLENESQTPQPRQSGRVSTMPTRPTHGTLLCCHELQDRPVKTQSRRTNSSQRER